MRPAWSVVLFTTWAGAAQGMVVAIAAAQLAGSSPQRATQLFALAVALVLLVAGLIASTFHLGHPERAWRAVLMWRTSWLSREVIVLPAFIGWVALWAAAIFFDRNAAVFALGAIALAAALWLCTAMIYACLKFIQEWAHWLTIANYTLIGLASGLLLLAALAVLSGESEFARAATPWALAATLAAWLTRALSLRRNAALRPKSTLQSATGIHAPALKQISMGMSAGAFNTREFFHGASLAAIKQARLGFIVLGFAVPSALLIWAMIAGATLPLLLAVPLQYAGLLAERWFFFAQARHPQNLYYQVVS